MRTEFDALLKNRTWTLVDRPPGAKVISGRWVYTHKLNSDGTLARYKARWVVRGNHQRAGVDFGETFTPVVKPATIRTVLTLIATNRWPAHQLDVSNAFLHGTLDEQVFCQQPAGFVDPERPDAVEVPLRPPPSPACLVQHLRRVRHLHRVQANSLRLVAIYPAHTRWDSLSATICR